MRKPFLKVLSFMMMMVTTYLTNACSLVSTNLEMLSNNGSSCLYSVTLVYNADGNQDANNGSLTFQSMTAGVNIVTGAGPYQCQCNGIGYTIQFNAPCNSVATFVGYYNQPGNGGANNCTTPPLQLSTFAPLPIDYAFIEGQQKEKCNVLTWQSFKEEQNLGFDVERSFDRRSFDKIGFVSSDLSITGGQSYVFHDCDTDILSSTVFYRLKQLDVNGNFSLSEIINVHNRQSDKSFTMQKNALYFSEDVEQVDIIDMSGQLVKTGLKVSYLDLSELNNGLYLLRFDGKTHKIMVVN